MPRPATLKVAAAQIRTALGDIEANHRKHLEVIEAARGAGIDVLVFPELSLVGHGAGAEAPRLGLPRDHELILALAEATGRMLTVAGFIEEAPGAQFYNAAAALRQGGILHCHRKVNLATYGRLEEGKHYARGRRVDAFDLGGPWRAGILVCADLWNPPLVHLAAAGGATLLLAPVSSAAEAVGEGFDNAAGWQTNLRFHALTYGLPIVMANRVGAEGPLTFWGGSRILDAFGATVAVAEGPGEALPVATLDPTDLRRARWRLPTLRDADPDLLAREFARRAAEAA